MSHEKNTAAPVEGEPCKDGTDIRYVGFCDILGFSNRILRDFDRTLELYRQFGAAVSGLPIKGTQITMYSDAVLVTGESLGRVSAAVQALWFVALGNDLMIRGAIAKGRYWEKREGNNLLVASDALVRAVKLEKSVGVPAVVIADDIEIPDDYWLKRFGGSLLETPLLHFRDRNIVNPFNTFWFASAETRALQLMADSPSHQDKYLWFLALHRAVSSGQELIPPSLLERFVREGVLKKRTKEDDDGK
jgi:hypothetical protein